MAERAHYLDYRQGEHSLLAGLSGVEFVVYDKSTGSPACALSGANWRIPASMCCCICSRPFAPACSLGLKANVRVGYDKARAKDAQHWFTQHQLAPACQRPRAGVIHGLRRLLGVEDDRLEWNLAVPAVA